MGGGDQNHPQEKRNARWQSGCQRRLQIAEKRREVKDKGEREKYYQLNAELQKIARRDQKAFLKEQCKEIEENNRWERLEMSSRKLELLREEVFPIRMGTIKDRNSKDLTEA